MDWLRVALARARLDFEVDPSPIPEPWQRRIGRWSLLFTGPDQVVSLTHTDTDLTVSVAEGGRVRSRAVRVELPEIRSVAFSGWAVFPPDDPRRLSELVEDPSLAGPDATATSSVVPAGGALVQQIHDSIPAGPVNQTSQARTELRFLVRVVVESVSHWQTFAGTIEFRWRDGHLWVHDHLDHPEAVAVVVNEFGYYWIRGFGGPLEVRLPNGDMWYGQTEAPDLGSGGTIDRYGIVIPTLPDCEVYGYVLALRPDRAVEVEVPCTVDDHTLDRHYYLQREGGTITVDDLATGRRVAVLLNQVGNPIGYVDRFRLVLVRESGQLLAIRDGQVAALYQPPEDYRVTAVNWLPPWTVFVRSTRWLPGSVSNLFVRLRFRDE